MNTPSTSKPSMVLMKITIPSRSSKASKVSAVDVYGTLVEKNKKREECGVLCDDAEGGSNITWR